jgi:hypothetical protein
MFELLESTIKPLSLNSKVLDVAYELYLQAPQETYPTIELRSLSKKTGKSLLECRNAIVAANKLGRFPDCKLQT